MPDTESTETGQPNLISKVISWSAHNAVLTVLLAALMGLWGFQAMRTSPLDAIPDLSDTQVIVLTEWPGQSPDLVEDQVTYPLSATLMSAPGVETVRAQSFFGLSFVNVIFDDNTDLYWARSRVLETLSTLGSSLPEDARPTLGPDATGVGWVYMYALVDDTGKHDLADLRTLQDWTLRYALERIPGVAEVAAIGGFEKEYQVQVDPQRLLANNISLEELAQAIRESNSDTGGGTLEIAGHEYMIRGKGLIRNKQDLEGIPLRISDRAAPLRLRDVAEVSLGPATRRGLAEWNGQGETVGGIVVMRQGENALKVIQQVQERLDQMQTTLPEGVRIEVAYDRSELIEASIGTLKKTLIKELVVVSLVIAFFLLSVRSALVPILCLPLAVLLAFIPLAQHGLTLNIMSLGGIAVAIGAMVDASIILVENVHKRLEEKDEKQDHKSVVISAMQEVGPSIFFSLLVIAVAFLPVFTLQATEGRLFKPLALTKTYAMGFAALLAITLTPALIALLIRGETKKEDNHPLSRHLSRLYAPVVRFVVKHRFATLGAAVLAMALTIPAAMGLQTEFMPPLNEGVILYMPSSPPGMSVSEATKVVQAMDKLIMEVPEVKSVLGKMGRADTATDPAPLGMAETTIVLKPKDEWRDGLQWEDLIAELDAKLQFPGMPNIWWMPIQTRTEMLTTGVRSPLAVQLFGDDLHELEAEALLIERALSAIPGTRSAFAERATGGFYLDFEINREQAARYGLRVAHIQNALAFAVGGKVITQSIEGRQRFGVKLRYAREFRDNPALFDQILVHSPTGTPVPITQVADVRFTAGPPMIRSEDGQLTTFVFVDPGEVTISEYVRLGQAAMLDIPPGTGIQREWTGQYKTIQRLQARLKLVLPLTLVLVALLLYFNTKSLVETLIVLLAVPFSLIGAVWMLWFLDYNLSVAVWVGIIALAGLDAETGVIMLLYLRLAEKRAKAAGRLRDFGDLEEAIVEGAAGRMRPKLMTVMTTLIGLTPLLLSTGPGADVMKRIAAPMVGGLTSSFLLELMVYPAIFAIWRGRGHLQWRKPPITAKDSSA
jgi:Cu(I)/Ag(I) efflux system membrane protein CusA/SilA